MIVFREKLFNCPIHNMTDFISERDEKYFENGPLNFIKAIEMWDFEDSKYVFHWLCDIIMKKTALHIHNGFSTFTPQMAFVGVESNSKVRSRILGVNNNDIYEELYGDSFNFCKAIITRMLTEPHRGTNEPKYESWFRVHPIKDIEKRAKEHEKALKYVALCLSGQLDPEVDGYSESSGIIYKTEVNYRKINSWSYDYQVLSRKIILCARNILGKDNLDYPKLLEKEYESEFNASLD